MLTLRLWAAAMPKLTIYIPDSVFEKLPKPHDAIRELLAATVLDGYDAAAVAARCSEHRALIEGNRRRLSAGLGLTEQEQAELAEIIGSTYLDPIFLGSEVLSRGRRVSAICVEAEDAGASPELIEKLAGLSVGDAAILAILARWDFVRGGDEQG